jgi:hypothetical protein
MPIAGAEALPFAPGRGRYDRARTQQARHVEQFERLLQAMATVLASDRELSVSNIVSQGGVGRNTFYEYFDDLEHALRGIDRLALGVVGRAIGRSLMSATTPLDQLDAVSEGWTVAIEARPRLARIALRCCPAHRKYSQVSTLGRYVADTLFRFRKESETYSALPGIGDDLRVLAVAGVYDALSRIHLGTAVPSRARLQVALFELSSRMLR